MSEYTKPFLTYEQQADLLISRGLICDKNELINKLKRVGYYRLSGYLHLFKVSNDKFIEDTTLDNVYEIYRFDRQLRVLTIDAIERFEVYVRTNLIYKLSEKYGAFGYLDKDSLPRLKDKDYEGFILKCKRNYSRSSEVFVKHFKEVYGDTHHLPPYWMLANLMDFGMVFTLYRGAEPQIRQEIASDFNVKAKVFESWLRSINTVRNICAHHSRLWNKPIGAPIIPKDKKWDTSRNNHKVYCILSILSYILNVVAPNSSWKNRFINLLHNYPNIDLRRMGFPENWDINSFWADK